MHPSKAPTAHWISMDGPCKAALARPTSRERQFDWAGGSCSWQCAVEPRQGATSARSGARPTGEPVGQGISDSQSAGISVSAHAINGTRLVAANERRARALESRAPDARRIVAHGQKERLP